MPLSNTARIIGLIAAIAMLLFSIWMYFQTADWVALIFVVGSLGYIVVFFTASTRS